MKKYLLFLAALVLMSGNARAEIVTGSPESGNGCGVNCSWFFDTDTGVLDIIGSGEMDEFGYDSVNKMTMTPWQAYHNDVLKVNVTNYDGEFTTIGMRAFQYFENVTEVNLPNTIQKIGYQAFTDTFALKNFEIPSSVTTIEQAAFLRAGMENIVVPDSVTRIDDAAFVSPYLRTLVLPENLLNVTDSFLLSRLGPAWGISNNLLELYCGDGAKEDCQNALNWLAEGSGHEALHPIIYSKDTAGNYYMYDDKGNMVGKYASLDALKGKSPSETYKYDSAGHLVSIFDGNGQRTWGKKIYTVEEAMEVTKNGDKFHVYLTYK